MQPMINSEKYLERATKLIPALSQTFSKSPYSYVEGVYPMYISRGKGSHIFDVDDNEFIDYVLGLGPVSLGYCYKPVDEAIMEQLSKGISFSMPHYLEIEFAEKLQEIIPGAEMMKFSKTGSDAVTACVRAARAYTKRDHILYSGHGGVWHDWFTTITSRNEGIPEFNNDLISLFKYNDIEDLENKFKKMNGTIAAVVMEPMWLDLPQKSYLNEVKEIAHKYGALLIFDEVFTGFRLSNGGAQELFGVEADLVAFGKAIGNGVPLGAITGKEEYMKKFNDIFYSTTYGGETLSLAAGKAVVNEYLHHDVIDHMWKIGKLLKDGFNKISLDLGISAEWKGLPVRGAISFSKIETASPNLLKSIFLQECIKRGTMFGPGEVCISYSHSLVDVKETLNSIEESMLKLQKGIETNSLNQLLEGKEIKSVMTF